MSRIYVKVTIYIIFYRFANKTIKSNPNEYEFNIYLDEECKTQKDLIYFTTSDSNKS